MVGWIVALSALVQFFLSVCEQVTLQNKCTVEWLVALHTIELLLSAVVGHVVIVEAHSTCKCPWTQVAEHFVYHLHLWTHLPELTTMAENDVKELTSAYSPFHWFLVGHSPVMDRGGGQGFGEEPLHIDDWMLGWPNTASKQKATQCNNYHLSERTHVPRGPCFHHIELCFHSKLGQRRTSQSGGWIDSGREKKINFILKAAVPCCQPSSANACGLMAWSSQLDKKL